MTEQPSELERASHGSDPRIGKSIEGYVIQRVVADGAMGRVYEATHPDSQERVAIKVLHDEVAKDEVAVERFSREFETAQELDHPNVVHVQDYGATDDGSWYMVMEYLEGEELGEVIRRDGALPLERVVRIVSQAARALDHAHSFGVVHRDLKPDNIFLCATDEGDLVRLLDFGSVKLQVETGPKLTAFGTTLGSPYYMSPEQAMGKQDVDHRTDVFALTAILFEMLTGKIAFEAGNVAQILMKIVSEARPSPSTFNGSVPPALDDVVEKGLRKEKERRYENASAMARALCAGLGLGETAEEWGNRSPDLIRTALQNATPAEPRPFGVPSQAPPGERATPKAASVPSPFGQGTPASSGESIPPTLPSGQSRTLWIVLAIGAIVVAAAIGLMSLE